MWAPLIMWIKLHLRGVHCYVNYEFDWKVILVTIIILICNFNLKFGFQGFLKLKNFNLLSIYNSIILKNVNIFFIIAYVD